MSGRISFIGAGPGAADLITVRGARRITEADVVLWAASLVTPECIQEHARADAELIDSSRLTHEEAIETYRRAERDGLNVARVYSGDPSLWGAVREQYDACSRMDLEVEVVPGVAAFSAAAATVGRELTVPEVAQSVVLTRLDGGKSPMPDDERVREFAKHGTTMAITLAAARTGQLVEELRAGGYADDVPVLVAYKVSWPDELILRTTLGELEQAVKQHRLWRNTLFIVGRALTEGGSRSRPYGSGNSHSYRRADPAGGQVHRGEQGRNGKSGARRSRQPAYPSDDEETGEPETVPEQRGSTRGSERSNSDIAWWAVRNWQESARHGTRVVPRSSTGRRAGDSTQTDLFVDAETGSQDAAEAVTVEAGGTEKVSEIVDFSVMAPDSGDTAPREAEAEAEQPGAVEDVAQPTEAEPVEPVESVESAEPVERVEPVEPVESAEPAEPESRSKGRATGAKAAGTKAAGTKATGTKSGAAKAAGSKSGGTKSGGARRKSGSAKQDEQAGRE